MSAETDEKVAQTLLTFARGAAGAGLFATRKGKVVDLVPARPGPCVVGTSRIRPYLRD